MFEKIEMMRMARAMGHHASQRQAGTLRLAVRSADEQRLSKYWAGEQESSTNLENAKRSLYQFNQLSLTSPARAPVSSPAGAPRVRGIEVIRGNQTAQQSAQ